jgi:hypothetical protein
MRDMLAATTLAPLGSLRKGVVNKQLCFYFAYKFTIVVPRLL